ncbi:hypothetical protein AB0A05_35510 [Streptomyces sp. NPDC046374]|uniref:hypothetical protein n=1 Tax=Streptomyces sp. NPDC046374 TaxID=3154917 RepID=UPI0033D1F8AD
MDDEIALYDGEHRVARLRIDTTTPDALARAQHILAAGLAPWTDSILLLARAARLRTPRAVRIHADARMQAYPHLSGTWPNPHTRQAIVSARASLSEADALARAAADVLPDAGARHHLHYKSKIPLR